MRAQRVYFITHGGMIRSNLYVSIDVKAKNRYGDADLQPAAQAER